MLNNHLKTKLSYELTLLINCCQTNPTEDNIEEIRTYLLSITTEGSEFWEHLIALANQHGILPLVYKSLKEVSKCYSSLKTQHLTPLELNYDTPVIKMKEGCNIFLSDLKAAYTQIAQRNMLMSVELLRIMRLLDENSIEALAFKGPTLSQMAYEDITLRQYGDLDILIKKKDRDKINKTLESEGYKQVLNLTSVQEKNWYKHAKDMSLFHAQKGIHIELHWLLLDNDYPIQINLSNIWEHPKSVVINRQKIETFSNESLLVYLCIHGSKHLWERIEWIKDIDLIIRTQTIDWDLIAKEMKKSDFKRMFLLGLHLSSSFFQTPLPTMFNQQMNHQNWLIKLTDFVISDWEAQRNMFHNSLAMIHLFPNVKMKLHYLYKVILKPSQSEYKFVDLPKGLYWVYYLIRPYLLIKKYLIKK